MTAGHARIVSPTDSHLEALRRLAGNLAADLGEAEVVRVLLDAVTIALDAPFGLGVLVRDDGLLVVAALGEGEPVGTTHDPGWPTPAGEATRTGSLVVVTDVAADERYGGAAIPFGSPRARAGLALPLVHAGRVLGALSVGFEEPRAFSPEERELLGGLASAGAVALERARLARQELSSRGMFDAVLRQIPLGIGVTDARGRTLFRNEALVALWQGSGPGDTVADPERWQGFHPDGRPYAPEEWPSARCLQGESVEDEEIAIVRFDGSRGVISVRAEPIRDAEGAIVGAVAAVIDITHRREAEAMRDAFVNILSHELRTPVTSIYGAAKVLVSRWRRLSETLREELLTDVAAESDRLQRLVEDLVVLAKVERGVDLSAREPVLVQHRVRAIAGALSLEWPDRTFVVEVAEGVPPAVGDEGYVEQVLRNLLGNAAKYGRSEVRARVTFDAGWVEVDVLDDGPGIGVDDPDRLFDLFYRSTAVGHVPGAGIGLFVARRLVDAMGGRLSAEDRPEGGAMFRMALRRLRGADVDAM